MNASAAPPIAPSEAKRATSGFRRALIPLGIALASGAVLLWLAAPRAVEDVIVIVLSMLTAAAGKMAYDLIRNDGMTSAELRARRNRTFMQRVIDALPEPVFIKNKSGQLSMVNNAYCAQRQLSREYLLGKSAMDMVKKKAFGQFIAGEDQEVLAGKTVLKEECIPHQVTGEPLHQIVSKIASQDEEGEPIIIGTFLDITKIRLAEQEARESLKAQTRLREFLQVVLDALPNPLFVKDTDHRYIMTNRAHSEVVGISAQELLGRRASDIIGKESATSLEAEEEEMLLAADGIISESERSVPNQHGMVRHEILRKVVGRDAEGQRVIIGTSTSITSLRQAEARWQFALEGAGDGVWDWNLTSGKVFYSPRWKAMQGFSDEEIGDGETERTRRLHPDDREGVQAALDVHLSGYVPIYICELRQLGKDGEYTWFMDRGQVVERSADGTPLRMIGIYTDITQHKHAEEELRRHRDSLKEMIAEQTADLVEAKDAAESANAAKSRFLANMSHELRTPMHAVLSFARLGEEKAAKAQLISDAVPSKLGMYFQRIRESGDRLLHLLNDLLDLSKLEAGSMVLHIQRFDFNNTVHTTLREFEASLLAKQLKTKVVAEGCNTFVMADATRMDQVVRNLLSNAIKFSPEGSCITLSFQVIDAVENGPGPMLELTVADEGIGIPANELETVFDKFIQSSKTRSNAGGTGLGLPICREIINAHQGQIFARGRTSHEAAPEIARSTTCGTDFVVRIPRHPPPLALPAPPTD